MRLLDSFKVDDDHCVFPALRAGGVGRRHEVTDQTLVPTRLASDDLTRGASRRVRLRSHRSTRRRRLPKLRARLDEASLWPGDLAELGRAWRRSIRCYPNKRQP
jgi:hypothetical protein